MAYGVLAVNYGSDKIVKTARSAATQFADAKARVESVSKKITSIGEHSGHGYVSSASAFLKKKAQQYDTKAQKLVSFAGRVDTVMSNAENADKRVATHLDQSYKSFQNITGLHGGFFATLGNLLEGLADFMGGLGKALFYALTRIACPVLLVIDAVKLIKKLYGMLPDSVKYILKAVGAFVAMVFAVVLFIMAFPVSSFIAFVGMVGAFCTAVTASMEFLKAATVATAYFKFGAETAKIYDDLTTANFVGMLAHEAWGWDAHLVSSIYTGVKVVGIVCSLVKGISSLSKAVSENGGFFSGSWSKFKDGFFNVKDWKMGVFSFETMKWGIEQFGLKEVLFHWPIDDIIKGTKEIYGLIDLGLNLVVFEPWDSTGEFAIKEIIKNIPVIGSLYKGGKEIVSAFDKSYQLVSI